MNAGKKKVRFYCPALPDNKNVTFFAGRLTAADVVLLVNSAWNSNFFPSRSTSNNLPIRVEAWIQINRGPPNLPMYTSHNPCTIFAKTASLRATCSASGLQTCFVLLSSAPKHDLSNIKYKRRRVERYLLWIVMAERLLRASRVCAITWPNQHEILKKACWTRLAVDCHGRETSSCYACLRKHLT